METLGFTIIFKMLYIVTPCSRPENLETINKTIPCECKWIVSSSCDISCNINATIIKCPEKGLVGTKERNYVLDNFQLKDEDYILFHDDDNIIHEDLYSNIEPLLKSSNLFSIVTWGQLFKNNKIRLDPCKIPKVGKIDTACFMVNWKYNKNVRHVENKYEHDGIYAEECSRNGPILTIDKYLSYYNYLRN